MKLAELNARRAHVGREMRALLDRNPGRRWSAQHQTAFDRGLTELEGLENQIDKARASFATSLNADIHEISGGAMLRAFLSGGPSAFSEGQARYYATLSTTTGSQGGFTVDSDVSARIVDTLKDYSGVRRVAEVIPTATGNALPWPTSDGTAELGEVVAENATPANLDPNFGTAPLTAWRYSSKVITAPFELLQDSAVDFEAFIADRVAQRIGRISNQHFTTGSGTGQPNGFATAASVGKTGTTGQTSTIVHDDVVDLIHSVNGEYRQDLHGAQFQTSDLGFKMLRKVKDTQGRPIYLPSDGATPESVMGYPVVINNDVAAPAASARSVFFGCWWRGYKVRDALDITVYRMIDSAYASKGQVAFIAFMRIGGNLVDTAAVKAYQNSAT